MIGAILDLFKLRKCKMSKIFESHFKENKMAPSSYHRETSHEKASSERGWQRQMLPNVTKQVHNCRWPLNGKKIAV